MVPGETDAPIDVDILEVRWHDDDSLRNLAVGQVYFEFRCPIYRVGPKPHWEEAVMTPNLTTEI